MIRKEHLRRVAITCLHCIRNYAYFRAGPDHGVLEAKGQFWISVYNNFLDICVLEWCKLFGDRRGKHYWEKILSNKQEFFERLLQKSNTTELEWKDFVNGMRTYRDKFIAHLDLERAMFIPKKLRLACESSQYLYNYILEKEDEGNFFDDAPSSATLFFQNHLRYGKAEYEKLLSLPLPGHSREDNAPH